jgi:hypothetical protein
MRTKQLLLLPLRSLTFHRFVVANQPPSLDGRAPFGCREKLVARVLLLEEILKPYKGNKFAFRIASKRFSICFNHVNRPYCNYFADRIASSKRFGVVTFVSTFHHPRNELHPASCWSYWRTSNTRRGRCSSSTTLRQRSGQPENLVPNLRRKILVERKYRMT